MEKNRLRLVQIHIISKIWGLDRQAFLAKNFIPSEWFDESIFIAFWAVRVEFFATWSISWLTPRRVFLLSQKTFLLLTFYNFISEDPKTNWEMTTSLKLGRRSLASYISGRDNFAKDFGLKYLLFVEFTYNYNYRRTAVLLMIVH